MMFRYLILLFLYLNTYAQINPVASFCAMGNTGTALQGIGSLTSNPAGSARLKTVEVGSYYQAHFLDQGIRTVGALLGIPTKIGLFGVHVSNYGIARVYTDAKASFIFGRAFGPKLAIATAVNYHQLRIKQYGSSNAYSVDLGAQYQVTSQWVMGIHIGNPGNASYDETAQAIIPVFLRLGTSFRVHEKLLLTADAEQLFYGQGADLRAGMEYGLGQQFVIRGGLALQEMKRFCGFGLQMKGMTMDMTAVIHPRLGISPQLFFAYAF